MLNPSNKFGHPSITWRAVRNYLGSTGARGHKDLSDFAELHNVTLDAILVRVRAVWGDEASETDNLLFNILEAAAPSVLQTRVFDE